uniref:Uncharacterized protein n=1 Tax=Periophthalmus magnuspinnatus TaxID=409849 RepID=A0A3B4A3G3_9GOBI
MSFQGERLIRSASPVKSPAVGSPGNASALVPSPQSAPAQPKSGSLTPRSIFPFPSNNTASPKSPRRLSFSGIFRSSGGASPSASIKIFRNKKGKCKGQKQVTFSKCQGKHHPRLHLTIYSSSSAKGRTKARFVSHLHLFCQQEETQQLDAIIFSINVTILCLHCVLPKGYFFLKDNSLLQTS